MWQSSNDTVIPGYTGHRQHPTQREEPATHHGSEKKIPGYQGYLPAVKAENMFGRTYGKISQKSSNGQHAKGLDLQPPKKFLSMSQKHFVDQKGVKAETAAQIVGVNRGPELYKKPIPPQSTAAFWGLNAGERDQTVQNSQFDHNRKTFFADQNDENFGLQGSDSDFNEAAKKFYGAEDPSQTRKLGNPIPGYCGVNRRMAADNVFGFTFEESKKQAQNSIHRIDQQRADQLRDTSKFTTTWKS